MAKINEYDNLTADDLDYGSKYVGSNNTNPLFTEIFNQPAEVDNDEFEYKVVSLSELHEFPNHPYKVVVDDAMLDLRDSIVDNGILQPLIVRPRIQGGYTIISGHRRQKAASLAKISSVPVIVTKNINDAQATIMMVDSNKQREVVLPSEKAYAYKMRLEAMKRQAGRPSKNNSSPVETKLSTGRADINSVPLGPNLIGTRSNDELAVQTGDSTSQIKRYIRLTNLIPQLLDLVDNDTLRVSPSIAFRPAVEISFLTVDEQKYFYDTVKTLNKTPSVQQATKIKKLSQENKLTQTAVMEILIQDKPNQRETVKFDYQKLGGYFKETLTPSQCESRVFDSLDSLAKIRSSVQKHVRGKVLTDEEVATLVDNLLTDYSRKTSNKRNEYAR